MKHCLLKKITAAALTIALLFASGLSTGVMAYSNGTPNTWENTGNGAKDIVQVALSQVGYTETSSNHTKYAAWFYGTDKSVAWCGIFISWCADQAGISHSVIAKSAMASGYSTSNMTKNGYGAKTYAFGSTSAKAGDIIYVDNTGNNVSNHVGLVYAVDDTYIYTVEGNYSSKVAKVKYLVSTGNRVYGSYTSKAHIVFYARPAYTVTDAASVKNTGTATVTAASNTTAAATTASTSATSTKSASTTGYTKGTYKVTASSLTVRSKASSSGKSLGNLSKGDIVTITGISGKWGSFAYNGSTGWICLEYASKTSDSTDTTAASSTDSKTYTTGSYKLTCMMNVRTGADTTYKSLGTLSAGTVVKVTKVSGRFGCISYNGKTGWVSLKYAEKTADTTSTTASAKSTATTKSTTTQTSSSGTTASTTTYSKGTYEVTASTLTVRSKASTDSKSLGTLKKGTTVKVTYVSSNFGAITYKGQTGWVCLEYAKKTTDSASSSTSSTSSTASTASTATYKTGTYQVTGASLTVRSEADKSSKSLGIVHKGDKFKVTAVSGRFGKITYNGKTGWISLKYCSRL